MNRETTDKMLETRNVDNNKIPKALFANLRPLHVTDMRYLEECSGSECRVECVVLFIVQS